MTNETRPYKSASYVINHKLFADWTTKFHVLLVCVTGFVIVVLLTITKVS
jgi:hypothetical protein